MLEINTKVKDFTLLDGNNIKHSLSDYLGKMVVLYFYPKNDTPGCTEQACSFRDNFHLLKERDVVVLGVSGGSTESHKEFGEKYHLPYLTLSDEDFAISKYFGVYGEKEKMGEIYEGIFRTTFIIDEKGIIINVMK